jgi:hypothetical protein
LSLPSVKDRQEKSLKEAALTEICVVTFSLQRGDSLGPIGMPMLLTSSACFDVAGVSTLTSLLLQSTNIQTSQNEIERSSYVYSWRNREESHASILRPLKCRLGSTTPSPPTSLRTFTRYNFFCIICWYLFNPSRDPCALWIFRPWRK